jgi:hypothetical protein
MWIWAGTAAAGEAAHRNHFTARCVFPPTYIDVHIFSEATMRGIVLWLLGVPVSIIVLLYLFNIV